LKPVNKHINYDLRVASAIKFKEGKQENMGICISLLNSVVLKDDVIMQSDKRLIELLDEILYNHLTDKDWTLPFMLEDDEE
jgi:hypothetical protein